MGFLRTPKIRSDERSWSVILHPLRGELDKKRVAEKISELFRLSFEEARELVQSTPLILLDELSHEVAFQAQAILQEARAEVTLTNDFLAKRRCYRAVWPVPLNLSFLDAPSPPVAPDKRLEKSSLVPEDEDPVRQEPFQELEKKYRELESRHQEQIRENQELKRRLEKNSQEIPWEERYANLKEEHQETKAILEEKVLASDKEFEGLKGQLRERMEETIHWRDKYQSLTQQSGRFENLYEEERRRREKTEESWRQASGLAESANRDLEIQVKEMEQWRRKCEELEGNQKRLEQELAQISEEREAAMRRLREENQQLALQLESAQRQVREYLFQVEQQELIEKRTRLTNELAAKESRLRELALEGDRLRQEIQDRELQVQAVVSERANLEREVLEVRQAQRFLLEQSKLKEKNNKLKRPSRDLGLEEPTKGVG